MLSGDTATRKEKNNLEEEERLKKLQNDQELRRRQEEEMAQVYPAKYSWANGENVMIFHASGANNDEAKVFDTYGGNLESPLIRAHVDNSSHLQIEREMKNVSKATPRVRQKWQDEEHRTASLSPIPSRKHSQDNIIIDHSADQDDKAALEEKLRQLQLEAQLAR